MQITHPHTLLILAWLAIGQLCTGCSAEDIAGEAPSEMGVLCLQMSSGEDFVQVETRAEQTLTDFSFTLSNGQELSFTDDGKAIIPAGTYTLSATNANAVDGGYTGALYSGSSEEFTITAGGTTPVTISLGAPKNAKVTISLSAKFTELYTFSSLTLKEGEEGEEEGHTLTPDVQVAYFPATNTTLSYTLVANANKNSHVQDITGATGTVTIAPGKHTTLTLVVNPIDPNLVTIDTGTPYNGEFQ